MPQKLAAPVDALRRIDTACDRYETDWRAGRSPLIEAYIAASADAEREELLVALVRLDAELRGETLDGLLLREYLKRFPLDARTVQRAFPKVEGDQPPGRHSTGVNVEKVANPPNRPANMSEQAPGISLEVTDGPHRGARFEFDKYETLVAGRAEAAQLRLQDDPHFSRHHFRLEVNPPTCYLLDLGSRNGTKVNGEKVKECFLKNGDVISGGRTKIRFSVAQPIPATLDEPPPAAQVAPRVPPVPAPAPAPEPARQPVIPRAQTAPTIPGYELHEELGRGAMGAVYRAVQKATRQECAVKVLTPAQVSGEKSLQLFLREVNILSQLKHRRIVRFIELGSAGRSAFFAMECVPTVSFEEIVNKRSLRTKVQIACGIACQVLEALEYAHGMGLVHRDVKPANILLTRQGSKLLVKLADFGLAKSFTNAGFSEVSRDGDICGSLAFMSPEQLINSRQARPACDLYSLAATLYRYLTGESMFEFEEGPCKYLAVLEQAPIPLLKKCPKIPKELAAIVHKSLAKDPDERHASARHMRQAIEKLLTRLRR